MQLLLPSPVDEPYLPAGQAVQDKTPIPPGLYLPMPHRICGQKGWVEVEFVARQGQFRPGESGESAWDNSGQHKEVSKDCSHMRQAVPSAQGS